MLQLLKRDAAHFTGWLFKASDGARDVRWLSVVRPRVSANDAMNNEVADFAQLKRLVAKRVHSACVFG